MRLEGNNRLVVSRRNLLALLTKLDGNPLASACTIEREGFYLQAEEDVVHYADRPAGPMHHDTERGAKILDALRKCVQAIEDAYGGYAFVPEGSFEREAVDEARALLGG